MRPARGLALGELMLALVLGQLLLLSALAWLQGSLQLAVSQRLPAQLLDGGLWLRQRLALAAGLAGEGSSDPFGLSDERLSAWWPLDDAGVGRPASDSLLLVRQAPAEVVDCEGNRVAAGRRLVERFFVRNDSAASGRALACDAGSCDDQGCSGLGDSGVALQGDIDSLQVLYGLAAGPGQAGAYLTAAALRAMPAGTRVATVRIALLLHARERTARQWPWRLPPDWPGPAVPSMPTGQATAAWVWTLAVPHG